MGPRLHIDIYYPAKIYNWSGHSGNVIMIWLQFLSLFLRVSERPRNVKFISSLHIPLQSLPRRVSPCVSFLRACSGKLLCYLCLMPGPRHLLAISLKQTQWMADFSKLVRYPFNVWCSLVTYQDLPKASAINRVFVCEKWKNNILTICCRLSMIF